MSIREAQPNDFETILSFCRELSSNFDENLLKNSFPEILKDADAAIFIVESQTNRPAGFIEVHLQHSLQSGSHGMIRALFVSERFRRSGYAKALVEKAERWVRLHGASKILVQSKTERVVADRFYLGINYEQFKVQNVYKKSLII